MINYQILNFNICHTLLAVVAEHGFLSPQFLTVSLMRVPIRSFGETNSALLRTRNATYWYIPGCDEQYRAPRTSSIHGSSSANIRNIIVSRDRARVRILILAVICWTRPRAQAVSTTAAAVQTSGKFGVIAVFEAFHSLVLHEESSFYNTGTWYSGFSWCNFWEYDGLRNFMCRFDEKQHFSCCFVLYSYDGVFSSLCAYLPGSSLPRQCVRPGNALAVGMLRQTQWLYHALP